jgi:ATP-dependent DNA ligase
LLALGAGGKPSFNLLQNLRSAESHIIYYAFDVLFRKVEDLTQFPLSKRREVIESVVKPNDHVALSQVADKTSAQMLRFVRWPGLEGVVAKRADSVYQPGLRTGLWSKQRVNLGQEFVIGGYFPNHLGLDSIVVASIVVVTFTTQREPSSFCACDAKHGVRRYQASKGKAVSLRESPRGRTSAVGTGIHG